MQGGSEELKEVLARFTDAIGTIMESTARFTEVGSDEAVLSNSNHQQSSRPYEMAAVWFILSRPSASVTGKWALDVQPICSSKVLYCIRKNCVKGLLEQSQQAWTSICEDGNKQANQHQIKVLWKWFSRCSDCEAPNNPPVIEITANSGGDPGVSGYLRKRMEAAEESIRNAFGGPVTVENGSCIAENASIRSTFLSPRTADTKQSSRSSSGDSSRRPSILRDVSPASGTMTIGSDQTTTAKDGLKKVLSDVGSCKQSGA